MESFIVVFLLIGIVESVLVTKLPISSTESLSTLSPTPNSGSPADQSNMPSSNGNVLYPINSMNINSV